VLADASYRGRAQALAAESRAQPSLDEAVPMLDSV
jgi:hypothetical protein